MVRVLILENDNGERFHTIRRFFVYKHQEIDLCLQSVSYDKITKEHTQHTQCIDRAFFKEMVKFMNGGVGNESEI